MRINKAFSFLIIICFFLSVFLHTIPQGLATKKLLQDINPPNSDNNMTGEGYGYNNTEKGQSRIGVQGSEDDHAGSAHGDSPPSEGTVQMRPPTALTKVETEHSQYYSPPEPQYQGGFYFSPPDQE